MPEDSDLTFPGNAEAIGLRALENRRKELSHVATHLDSQIAIDEPLPAPQILRYLASVCITEIQLEPMKRKDWVDQTLKVLKLERDFLAMGDEGDKRGEALSRLFKNVSDRIEVAQEVSTRNGAE